MKGKISNTNHRHSRYHDIDGDDITNIRIKDVSSGKQTGFFQYNKKTFQGTELPALREADLKRVLYHPGAAGINRIEVSASDRPGNKQDLQS